MFLRRPEYVCGPGEGTTHSGDPHPEHLNNSRQAAADFVSGVSGRDTRDPRAALEHCVSRCNILVTEL